MKKVLFATTALVASAGIASAQGVAISGSAEMGVVGGDRHGETQFWQSVDVRFSMTGETNGGLTFGATVDARDLVDMGQAGQDGTDIGGVNVAADTGAFADFTVFVAGDFGRVTMGDTDGAFDWALQEVAVGPGTIDDSHTFHAGWNGNAGLDGAHDGQVVRYDHGFGDFKFAVSVEVDDVTTVNADDPIFGIGVKYMASLGSVDLGIGLGYQTGEDAGVDYGVLGASLDANFAGGFRVVLNYSDLDGYGGNDSHMGIGASYTFDAISVGANYGVYDLVGGGENSGFGLAVNYDLGGGAVVQFGYGNSEPNGLASVDSYSLGIAMSF